MQYVIREMQEKPKYDVYNRYFIHSQVAAHLNHVIYQIKVYVKQVIESIIDDYLRKVVYKKRQSYYSSKGLLVL